MLVHGWQHSDCTCGVKRIPLLLPESCATDDTDGTDKNPHLCHRCHLWRARWARSRLAATPLPPATARPLRRLDLELDRSKTKGLEVLDAGFSLAAHAVIFSTAQRRIMCLRDYALGATAVETQLDRGTNVCRRGGVEGRKFAAKRRLSGSRGSVGLKDGDAASSRDGGCNA